MLTDLLWIRKITWILQDLEKNGEQPFIKCPLVKNAAFFLEHSILLLLDTNLELCQINALLLEWKTYHISLQHFFFSANWKTIYNHQEKMYIAHVWCIPCTWIPFNVLLFFWDHFAETLEYVKTVQF